MLIDDLRWLGIELEMLSDDQLTMSATITIEGLAIVARSGDEARLMFLSWKRWESISHFRQTMKPSLYELREEVLGGLAGGGSSNYQ